jgi:chromosome segregation ATPase
MDNDAVSVSADGSKNILGFYDDPSASIAETQYPSQLLRDDELDIQIEQSLERISKELEARQSRISANVGNNGELEVAIAELKTVENILSWKRVPDIENLQSERKLEVVKLLSALERICVLEKSSHIAGDNAIKPLLDELEAIKGDYVVLQNHHFMLQHAMDAAVRELRKLKGGSMLRLEPTLSYHEHVSSMTYTLSYWIKWCARKDRASFPWEHIDRVSQILARCEALEDFVWTKSHFQAQSASRAEDGLTSTNDEALSMLNQSWNDLEGAKRTYSHWHNLAMDRIKGSLPPHERNKPIQEPLDFPHSLHQAILAQYLDNPGSLASNEAEMVKQQGPRLDEKLDDATSHALKVDRTSLREHSDCHSRITELENDWAQADKYIDEKEVEISTLKEQLETFLRARSTHTSSDPVHKESESNMDNAARHTCVSNTTNEAGTTAISPEVKLVDELRTHHEAFEELKLKLAMVDHEKADLQSKLEDAENDLQRHGRSCSSKILHDMLKRRNAQFNDKASEIRRARDLISKLRKENEELTSNKGSMERIIQHMSQTIEVMKKSQDTYKEEIEIAEKDNTEWEKKAKELAAALEDAKGYKDLRDITSRRLDDKTGRYRAALQQIVLPKRDIVIGSSRLLEEQSPAFCRALPVIKELGNEDGDKLKNWANHLQKIAEQQLPCREHHWLRTIIRGWQIGAVDKNRHSSLTCLGRIFFTLTESTWWELFCDLGYILLILKLVQLIFFVILLFGLEGLWPRSVVKLAFQMVYVYSL